MRLPFTERNAEYAKRIGIPFDIQKDLSDEQIDTLTDAVSDRLQCHGFDEDYNPTEDGTQCEDILGIIGRY